MKYPTSQLVLLFGALWQAFSPLSHAADCKKFGSADIASIQARISTQEKVLESLASIEAGTSGGSMPLSALFSISLEDLEAVKNRANSLGASDKKTLESTEPYSTWLACSNSKQLSTVKAAINNQVEIDNKKAKFLSLPTERRDRLLALYASDLNKRNSLEVLDEEAKKVTERQQEAQGRLEAAETVAASDATANKKLDAGNVAVTQKFLMDLEENQLQFIQYKKDQTKKYEDLKSELVQLSDPEMMRKGPVETRSAYGRANEVWRTLVDHIFELYLSSDFLNTPVPPESVATSPDVESQVSSMNDLRLRYVRQEKEMISALLLDAGAMRSKLFNRCRAIDCDDLFKLTWPIVNDFLRENRVVPFKVFALFISKSVEARRKATEGLRGWVELSKQALYLLVFLILPFVFFYLLRWGSRKIDEFRRDLINRSMIDYKRRTKIAIWISRLNPFLPWVGMVVFTYIADDLLQSAEISEVGEVVFYLRFYFFYRISVLFLRSAFSEMLFQVTDNAFQGSADKIQKSSLAIARVIFIEVGLLRATSNAVREAYVYTVISFLVKYLNIVLVLRFCRNWKVEIRESARVALPAWLHERLAATKNRFLSFLITPVFLVLVVLVRLSELLYKWLATLKIMKWVGQEIFKKRLQNEGDTGFGSKELPKEYKDYFDFRSLIPRGDFVNTRNSHEAEILAMISDWMIGESDDDAILLHGNRGLGKSTLLVRLSEQMQNPNMISLRVPSKTTTREAFWRFFEESFGVKLTCVDDFFSFDRGLDQKVVVFLDDSQNLFLSELGQFEAYREFQDVLNLITKNIFWCVVLNSRSWNYLKGAFGPEHFYGRILESKPWSDTEIQTLILSRQMRSGFKYKFDKTIKAYALSQEHTDVSRNQAEFQFFRLLWGQARGNPRSALVYWLTALRYDEESRELLVGVPQFLESNTVAGLSDDALFVLAAITKHENLNIEETKNVTGIAASVVMKCIKQMERRELIWKDSSDRFRVSPRAQYLIDFYLLGRNFIHE
jgi:hypothetical protein